MKGCLETIVRYDSIYMKGLLHILHTLVAGPHDFEVLELAWQAYR